MYESQPQEQSKKVRRSWTMAVTGVGLFFGGLLVGRMLFPMEIAKPFIVERRVEVPVEKLVINRVEVPVDRRVEVPVEVVRVVEKPVEKIVYQDRIVEKTVFGVPPDIAKWRQLSKGMSRSQVRSSIRWESVITSLIGAVSGVILGIALGWVIVRALDDEGLKSYTLPIGGTIGILILSFMIGVIAAIYPARRATRMNVLESLSAS